MAPSFDIFHWEKFDFTNLPSEISTYEKIDEHLFAYAGPCREHGGIIDATFMECQDETEVEDKDLMTCEKLNTLEFPNTAAGPSGNFKDLINYDAAPNDNYDKDTPFSCRGLGVFYGLNCEKGTVSNTALDATLDAAMDNSTCATPEAGSDDDECTIVVATEEDDATAYEGGLRCKWIRGCMQDTKESGIKCKKIDGALSAIAASLIGLIAFASF